MQSNGHAVLTTTTHLHWLVWAYERIEPGTGNYLDNTQLDLIAPTADEALARAHDLLPTKPNLRVHSVIEHLDGQPCGHA